LIELVITQQPTEVVVLGAKGMLGGACLRAFGPEAVGRDLDDFDLADGAATLQAITALQPRLIVNCAAAAIVDRCETDHDYADNGNILAPKHVAQAAAQVGAKLVHISTVFVFDGDQDEAYRETDRPNPLNYYGQTKLAGDQLTMAAMPDALIVRTSWMYGLSGIHFPGKLLQWAAGGGPLRIVDDQVGSPTYAEDLAEALRALAERGASGLYHLGGAGCASRMAYTLEILKLMGLEVEVLPASSADFPLPAKRPANSCLDCSKAAGLGVELPPWRDALARYIRASRDSW
jgi:dTDP-4-dehydrorhamnose reductase